MGQPDEGTIFPASERVQGQAQSRRAYLELLDRQRNFLWWQDFQELLALGWDWRKAVYLAWAASPARDRDPATQHELATGVLGLASDRVIRIWRQQHPEMEEMIATLQAAPLLRHRRDVFEALAASAATPDPRHHADRKLALEMLGDYRPRGDLDVHTTGGGLTLAEWQAAAATRRAEVEQTLADFAEEEGGGGEDGGDEEGQG